MEGADMAKDDGLIFSKPEIAKRTYIVRGPSGHTEVFQRDKLDVELAGFLKPAPVIDMVSLFITTRDLSDKKEPTTWFTVAGFLGRTMQMSPKTIPPTVVIAFWAHIVVEVRAQDAAAVAETAN